MGICGIIAEFNPLHNGHKYLIDSVKNNGDTVVCVLSGSFVQRGEPSFISKWDRTRMALSAGADLCLELPVPWSMSTAANFAFGGISLLKSIGADTIAFGSESGDLELLLKASKTLQSDEVLTLTKQYLKSGKTFANARQSAIEQINPLLCNVISSANDILACEYITAAEKLNYQPKFNAVKRIGAMHDSDFESSTVSSSFIRSCKTVPEHHMPKPAAELLSQLVKAGSVTDYKKLDNMVLAALRLKSKDEFSSLPDISEGIENRLYESIKTVATLEELYSSVKSKRYTHARIRRLCMNAFLKIDNLFYFKPVPYIRPLGLSAEGEKILKQAANLSDAPILSRVAQVKAFNSFAQNAFECERRATDIFALCAKNPLPAGLDYTQKIIKI